AFAAIEKELEGDGPEKSLAAVAGVVAGLVELGELQRRLDGLGTPHPAVAAVAGGDVADDPSASAGLRADLAEVAPTEPAPGLALALTARRLFDPDLAGRPESMAAVAVLAGLKRELELTGAPILVDGRVALEPAARAFLAIAAVPPAGLRA